MNSTKASTMGVNTKIMNHQQNQSKATPEVETARKVRNKTDSIRGKNSSNGLIRSNTRSSGSKSSKLPR